jgi:ubiquinol-cytochrome c reductase cytochrome c subunit
MLALPGAFVFLPGGSNPATADPVSIVRYALAQANAGKPLYEEHCATCHGEQGGGTSIAPSIVGLGPAFYDFMMSTGRMPLDQPTQQAVRRPPVLSENEIQAITAYLTSLAPGGVQIPTVHPNTGSLSVGQQLYEDNCAPCHGATGNGGAVGPRSAPNLHHASALQTAEAVRIGPSVMPSFDTTTIPQPELDALVRYVLYLRHPEDPGGQPLNRAGPLIEGFVALVVGLGVLIVVTRFIGTRS